MTSAFDALLQRERMRLRRPVTRAAACAALAGAASVLLLGVSGWFITAAAGAGLAGLAAAQAFNYLLPSAAIRLLAIARTAGRYGERVFGHEAALQTLASVRPALFAAIAGAPASRALAVLGGDAVTSLVQDAGTLEASLVRRLSLWGTALAIGVGLLLTAMVGWAPALSTVACLVTALVLARSIAKSLHASNLATRQAIAALKQELAVLSASRAELRCYALGDWAAGRVAARNDALVLAQRTQAHIASRFDWVQATAIGVAAVAALGLARPAGAAMAALAALVAAMALDAASALGRHLLLGSAVADATARLAGYFESGEDLSEGEATGARPDGDRVLETNPTPDPMASTVARLRATRTGSLSLSLPGQPPRYLPEGTRLALIGPSGCGKTTLVETLLGLRIAEPGRIHIDRCPLERWPVAALRRHFAWLPQDAMLLAGTVRDNLLLADATGALAADEPALWRALHDAALDQRVQQMPQGLDTWIGENGALLSGGERRRLALARALAGDAPWLLLDEPTEGLDADTIGTVLERLASRVALTRQGVIVVSHHPSVALWCDEVLDLASRDVGHALGLAA